jgi:hypothetical protein
VKERDFSRIIMAWMIQSVRCAITCYGSSSCSSLGPVHLGVGPLFWEGDVRGCHVRNVKTCQALGDVT